MIFGWTKQKHPIKIRVGGNRIIPAEQKSALSSVLQRLQSLQRLLIYYE